MRIFITSILALAFVSAPSTFAQQQVKIREVPPKYTPPTSGAEMYRAYCASCHGVNGAGDGPAAPALKVTPTNLTLLSQHNHGRFPALQVQQAISGELVTPAHGNREMPVWGNVFKGLSADKSVVQIRVKNLADYIATMQKE